jgi:hypothetical protein
VSLIGLGGYHIGKQEDENESIKLRTSTTAATGRFELYKTSTHFGGTIKNPVWLG